MMNYVTKFLGRKQVSVTKLGRWGGVINNNANHERLIDWANMDNGFDHRQYEPAPTTPELKHIPTNNENTTDSNRDTKKLEYETKKYGNIKVNNNYTFDEMLPFVM